MVKDHVKNVMGPAAAAYANTMLKMSKLQAAQVQHRQKQGPSSSSVYTHVLVRRRVMLSLHHRTVRVLHNVQSRSKLCSCASFDGDKRRPIAVPL